MTVVSLKVLATAEDTRALWSVNVQHDFGPGRLCGAWIDADDHTLAQIIGAQPLHLTAGTDAPTDLDCALLDLPATRQAMVDEVDRLVELNRASRTPKGNPRAPLQRPDIPELPTTGNTDEDQLRGVVTDNPAALEALRSAHYLADLADAWSRIETLRLSREYLRGDTPQAREFPCVTTATREA
ncbi:hypothetical protein [Gordonia sp. VNK21]|uniref:hypothetical protein n=1 Tax=Gordonia sp. VNK21 TaxID=3382483 RepID=UPI0038D4F536